jgi:uncharacterized phage protein gp47/JayE
MSGATSPTAAWVDATGIHAPTFTDIVNYLIGQMQAIYGADIIVSNDTQDGQLLNIFALAIADANNACIAAYNSFSPSTAQGVGLSSNVKINGLTRALPSYSSVDLLLTGVATTEIPNGIAMDLAGNRWLLPPTVTIPQSGQVTVTATSDTAGAINAPPDTVTIISTVTFGWQQVTNPTAATPGAPVESDPALRARQAQSTALPALTVLSGIVSAVLALNGVIACKGYENDTSTDYTATPPPIGVDPLPPHSVSLVVQGGDSQTICDTILLKKTPGCYTYGSTRHTSFDVYGLPHDIGFFIPTQVPIGVNITLTARAGYSTIVGAAISNAVANYINGLGSGVSVIYSKLWLPANLCDATTGLPTDSTNTYDITAMTVATPPGGTYGTTNIAVAIFQIANCTPANVVITAH